MSVNAVFRRENFFFLTKSYSHWYSFLGFKKSLHNSTVCANVDEVNSSAQLYPGHIQVSPFQRAILSIGSTVLALTDPSRGDMVAVNGEATGHYALQKMYMKMMMHTEGQAILRDRPRINSTTVNLSELRNYPENSFGKAYTDFLDANKVTPDSRLPVRFVDHPELAYVMQRYREIHDLVHTLLGMPTNMLGEITVKWVEGLQTGLPMCIGGGIFGPLRLKPKHRQRYLTSYLPWALRVGTSGQLLMNVYFEKRWEQDIDELRQELNIESPPSK